MKLTLILFVSKSTQVTSFGRSYTSKNRESTPIKNGSGACNTSDKPSGHNGIYGHCHLKGNKSVTTASATAVNVEGLKLRFKHSSDAAAPTSTTKKNDKRREKKLLREFFSTKFKSFGNVSFVRRNIKKKTPNATIESIRDKIRACAQTKYV